MAPPTATVPRGPSLVGPLPVEGPFPCFPLEFHLCSLGPCALGSPIRRAPAWFRKGDAASNRLFAEPRRPFHGALGSPSCIWRLPPCIGHDPQEWEGSTQHRAPPTSLARWAGRGLLLSPRALLGWPTWGEGLVPAPVYLLAPIPTPFSAVLGGDGHGAPILALVYSMARGWGGESLFAAWRLQSLGAGG